MNDYLRGEKLYGDDFTFDQLKEWYEEESEGFADLGNKNETTYQYDYHNLNVKHGFKKLPDREFQHVLGFGSAWGHEFSPIINKISKITIIEPSNNMISHQINGIIPEYFKPNIDGSIPFYDQTFDLITSFGTLHHIANVSTVLKELIRVLKPGGYLLIREPINSMGDWSEPRKNLTKNERGIPIHHFENIFQNEPIKIISKDFCFTITSFLQRNIGHLFKHNIYYYRFYIWVDDLLSRLFKWNIIYHPLNKFQRIGPTSVFYVIKKNKI